MLTLAVATGLVVLFAWFLLSVRRLAGTRPVLTVASTAVLLAGSCPSPWAAATGAPTSSSSSPPRSTHSRC